MNRPSVLTNPSLLENEPSSLQEATNLSCSSPDTSFDRSMTSPGKLMQSNGQVDKDYLSQVLVKYLEYMATGEEKEAMTLERVLFTVLDLKNTDLKKL